MLQSNQVKEQKQRFANFVSHADLKKIGERYFHFQLNDNEDGRYTPYCYILRVLRLVANVGGCYYIPGTNTSYSEMLRKLAIETYLDSLKK